MRFSVAFHGCIPSVRRFLTQTVSWTQLRKHTYFNSQTPKETTKLFIHGEEVDSRSDIWVELRSPENNTVISHVPKSTQIELEMALESASQAAPLLSNIPATYRQSKIIELYGLMKEYRKEFEHALVSEAGKTNDDAAIEFDIALRNIRHYFSTSLPLGDSLVELRTGTDAFSSMESLGVTASITPFNYPLLIPVVTVVPALVAGNSMVTKPSEKVPGPTLLLAKLVKEAGFPDGSLNVLYGKNATTYFCDHPSVKAVTFWGSTKMGKYVFSRAGQSFKRVQCFNGAKNHTVVMPDANKSTCFQKLLEAAFGEAGQRCLSTSVAIFVGRSKEWITDFIDEAKLLTKTIVNSKDERKIAALISKDAKTRISKVIKSAEEQGADIRLDGRGIVVEGYEKGNFIGPTIICNVQTNMECYQEEIFGPVLCVFAVETLGEAIAMINANDYGNAAIIHTTSGSTAKTFAAQVDVGQVGVNVGITLPYPTFPYTGTKDSFYGSLYTMEKNAILFNSKIKTHLQNWKQEL